MQRATLAAGSFERVEETFRRIGRVHQTMVGYVGGWAPNPVYTGTTTGHAEVRLGIKYGRGRRFGLEQTS
jgi:peptide methionine sulfoxide reductase MsrA